MRVFVNNQTISLKGGSTVTNEQNEKVYKVKGKIFLFSPTRKKKIYNNEN